jgi:GH24 family phage-related lysozyme (muramidase)
MTFDGKRVSRHWHRALTEARRDGVRFLLTSGRRTMAEQTALFRQNMQFVAGRWIRRPGRPLTAFPNPNAPHIRVGRQDHAIDVNALDGGEDRLQAWLSRNGVGTSNPVVGEPWHLEAAAGDLRKLAKRLKQEAKDRRLGRKPAKERRLTRSGVNLIAEFEGFVPYAYNDAAGHATVGYGRLLHHGPVTAKDRELYGTKDKPKVSHGLAVTMLEEDAENFERIVRDFVKVPVTQGEFNALVSFSFNVGAAAATQRCSGS